MSRKLIVPVLLAAVAALAFAAPCLAQDATPDTTAQAPPPAETPPTSVETNAALQQAIAAHTALESTGSQAGDDVARLEAELAAARDRATTAGAETTTSAAAVFAAFETHISTLRAEHAAVIEGLRTAQAAYAAQ